MIKKSHLPYYAAPAFTSADMATINMLIMLFSEDCQSKWNSDL